MEVKRKLSMEEKAGVAYMYFISEKYWSFFLCSISFSFVIGRCYCFSGLSNYWTLDCTFTLSNTKFTLICLSLNSSALLGERILFWIERGFYQSLVRTSLRQRLRIFPRSNLIPKSTFEMLNS